MISLAGRVALVTGGAAGIGRATVLALARAGARVVVADVDTEPGERTVQQISEEGGIALFARTDVAQDADVRMLIELALEQFGRVDIGVNNAGIAGPSAATIEQPESLFDRLASVNFKGVWQCMKYEIPAMRAGGGGAIVNMSSGDGLAGNPRRIIYSATKHAVIGLTKSAALAYARDGIRVNAVCPGPVRTAILADVVDHATDPEAALRRISDAVPLGRVGEAHEIGNAVVWLCSDEASFVTGHAFAVDGGVLAG
jgi:NAD(P)-dependent dehydrogenase (short-subunit alcohol dehydrogenase family)